jgi:hypothetical protein
VKQPTWLPVCYPIDKKILDIQGKKHYTRSATFALLLHLPAMLPI